LKIKTIILSCFGFIFLAMGAIGILLPIWPTTPFVILAVACFSATPRIKAWIMRIPFFREHIENYQRRNGLSQKTFWQSIAWLWGMLLISILAIRTPAIYIILPIIGIAVTVHLIFMAKPKED